jgi:predicted DNA-binding transcriptional regulator AlpA
MSKPTPVFDPSTALLHAKQIATFLGCTQKHIRRMSERGDFPKPVKAGRRILRWPREAVEKWLAEQA